MRRCDDDLLEVDVVVGDIASADARRGERLRRLGSGGLREVRLLGDLALVRDRLTVPRPPSADGDRRRRPPLSRLPLVLNLLEDLECLGDDLDGDRDFLLADDDFPLLRDEDVDFPSDDERRDFSRRKS